MKGAGVNISEATRFTGTVSADGTVIASGLVGALGYQVGGTTVVSARKTGWAAATGTKSRATFVTDTVTATAAAQRLGALIDDLIGHGLIGA